MGIKRKGSAIWEGNLKEGRGRISTDSGVLKETQYSFGTRFENGAGTNPEELVGAAHAGCFSMALAAQLTEAGHAPKSIHTTATVHMEKLEAGFTVTGVRLDVDANVPGIDQASFDKAADEAKRNCPISRLLNTEITMETRLEG